MEVTFRTYEDEILPGKEYIFSCSYKYFHYNMDKLSQLPKNFTVMPDSCFYDDELPWVVKKPSKEHFSTHQKTAPTI